MSSLAELARPAIRALKPYVSARSITTQGRIFLDANEAPESGVPGRPGMNRYPEPQPRAVIARLASLYQVPFSHLLIGRGSDEAIELLVRVFCEPGRDRILITPPTYGVYEIAAAIQGAGVVRVPLRNDGDWSLDEEGIVSAARDPNEHLKLVFLCSPNNPTGTAFDPTQLARIAARIGTSALVVIDEAYAEWSRQESMLARLAALPNLVVLRTLSKAWAVAGARLGAALADPELLTLLHRVRAPYPLSTPAIELVNEALSPEAALRLQERVARVRAERERVAATLRGLKGVERIYRSESNFLLVEFANREAVLASTRERGIIARDRHSEPGLEGCIRITIGAASENDELLQLLRSLDS